MFFKFIFVFCFIFAKGEAMENKNVLGQPLESCSQNPKTGFYRNGSCETGPTDTGTHTVCAVMTQEFLDFTKSKGNDLSTPQQGFSGLKAGQRWCLCAARWREAFEAGKAPGVVLAATHHTTLKLIDLDALKKHAQ